MSQFSPNIMGSKSQRWDGCGIWHMWGKKHAHRALVEIPERKKPIENLGKDQWILQWIFKKVGRESVDRIHLAQDMDKHQTVVYTAMNLRVP
jgi:hypothetical protein